MSPIRPTKAPSKPLISLILYTIVPIPIRIPRYVGILELDGLRDFLNNIDAIKINIPKILPKANGSKKNKNSPPIFFQMYLITIIKAYRKIR